MLSRYRNAQLAIVASTLFTEGGDWRSIYLYARRAEADGRRVVLVNPRGKRGLRQALSVWAFSPRVIVNGLNSFDSLCVLAMCLCRSEVRIYLHETDHALDGYRQAHPFRYLLLRRIFRCNPLLCVSQKAETLYRERFGATRTHVVYECPGDDSGVKLDQGRIHIVNVGSLNARKGVELFSRVADLAKERHPEWQFHWVGSMATMDKLYLSPAVAWHGFMWHPNDLVKQCRLFFLSSVDDPCPLSAIEALQTGIGCVAYSKTGTAELLDGVAGCAVFDDYVAAAALAALEVAVKQSPDASVLKELSTAKVGYAAFEERIDRAFAGG